MLSELTIFMAQSADAEQPGMFPFPFTMHLVFCCISLIFFLYRFSAEKKPYQLILAIAIPFSLILWLSDSRSLFYFVGAAEFVMLIAAFIASIACKPKNAAPSAEPADSGDSEDEK